MGSLHCHQLSWLISWWEGGWTVKSCLYWITYTPMRKRAINGGLFCMFNTTIIALEITNVIWTSVLKCGCLYEDLGTKLQVLTWQKVKSYRKEDIEITFLLCLFPIGEVKCPLIINLKWKVSLVMILACFSFTHSDFDLNVVEFRIRPPR